MRNSPNRSNNTKPNLPKVCYFCSNGINEIDYKEVKVLQRFISSYAKILPRKKTGTCAKHQRKYAQAVKRARTMALIPFTTR